MSLAAAASHTPQAQRRQAAPLPRLSTQQGPAGAGDLPCMAGDPPAGTMAAGAAAAAAGAGVARRPGAGTAGEQPTAAGNTSSSSTRRTHRTAWARRPRTTSSSSRTTNTPSRTMRRTGRRAAWVGTADHGRTSISVRKGQRAARGQQVAGPAVARRRSKELPQRAMVGEAVSEAAAGGGEGGGAAGAGMGARMQGRSTRGSWGRTTSPA